MCDKVLAGANGFHLSSNGVHFLTQGNPVLLRLVPISVKPYGKRMNLIGTSGSPALGVAAGASSLVFSSELLRLLNFALGSGMGRRCYTFSSESNIETSASRHNFVMSEGCIRAPVHLP